MKYRIRKKPAGPSWSPEYWYLVEYKKWYWLYWKTHSKEVSEGAAMSELEYLKDKQAKQREQERIHKMDGEVIHEESDVIGWIGRNLLS